MYDLDETTCPVCETQPPNILGVIGIYLIGVFFGVMGTLAVLHITDYVR